MRLNRDVTAGAALLLVCGLAFYATTTFRAVPASLSQNVPPTFFPRVVLLALALLSLVLIATSARKRDEPKPAFESSVLTIRGTAGIFILTVVLVPYLGMLGTVCLTSIGLPLYWGERRVVRIVGLAVGLPLAVHLVFALALGMRFPPGVLW